MTLYPLKFLPILKTVIWGGHDIRPFKGMAANDELIGESWEVSAVPGHESVVANGPLAGRNLRSLTEEYPRQMLGEKLGGAEHPEFPLLIKLIDAQQNLSLQVHPDDALARERHNCLGKNEMWHIISTKPGAKILAGMSKEVEKDKYPELVASGEILDYVAQHESHPGDTFYIPAGRVHGIGAGNMLIEVQQSSDITYRIFDYNRRDANGKTRELHTEQALDAIDFKVYDEYRAQAGVPQAVAPGCEATLLVESPFFVVKKLSLSAKAPVGVEPSGSFVSLTSIEGTACCRVRIAEMGEDEAQETTFTTTIQKGESALIPASCVANATISGNATLIYAAPAVG
ncbi:MAG: class I mannose-6-phosphate isomerase [Clostridium sp.]|nr:class I mannose-6-phosphate isomerase [Clostridium sp.]